MIQNNKNIIIHLVKKIGYLVLLLFVSTQFFEFVFRNDISGSIMGDSSDWKVILINLVVILGYLFFLIIETISLSQKKLIAFRNVNIVVLLIIALFLVLAII